jgi:hypothetical protein
LDAKDGAYVVHLRWTPQRQVLVAVWLSLLGAVLCLGIALAGLRRRGGDVVLAPEPSLRSPWWATGPPLALLPTAATAVFTGLAAAVVVHPLFGLGIAVATVAALRLPRGRVVGLGGPVLVGAAAAFTVVKQWRNGYPPDFGWADFFRPAHYLAWGALWLLAVALLTDALRRSTDKSQGRPLDAHRDDGPHSDPWATR